MNECFDYWMGDLKVTSKNVGDMVPYINTYKQATFSVLTFLLCISLKYMYCLKYVFCVSYVIFQI